MCLHERMTVWFCSAKLFNNLLQNPIIHQKTIKLSGSGMIEIWIGIKALM